MKKLVIRNYQNGDVLKRVSIPENKSITYKVENGRMVIRDYNTGEKVKSVKCPNCSIRFSVEG